MVLHVSVRPRTCLSRGDGSFRMVAVGREQLQASVKAGWEANPASRSGCREIVLGSLLAA